MNEQLHPVPVPPISTEILDPLRQTLQETAPIDDFATLALHVAQLTIQFVNLQMRIERLERCQKQL